MTKSGSGELLSQTPIEGSPKGSSAWRIRYRSQGDKGAPIEVTGIVIVPQGEAPAGGRAIVSWGRGTVGLAPVCAPSKTPQTMFEKTPGIALLLAHGIIITASDFADPDSPHPHPYLVGLSEGRAMLDAVRATAAVQGASAGKRYALWGESEGAHAALWAAKLAPTYVPELQLVSIAVAAPPTDLIANFDAIKNPGVRALMTGYVSASWSEVYGIPLSTFANSYGQTLIHRMAKDCVRFDLASAATSAGLLVLSRNLPTRLGEPWIKPLQDNSVKPERLSVPLLIAQGGKDAVVSPALTDKFAAESCRAGTLVRYVKLPDAGHLDIADLSAEGTVNWLASRFAGEAPDAKCVLPVSTAAEAH